MSNIPETTQVPATTQTLKQNNNISDFMTSKAHIYINRKKGDNDTTPINKEMIYNIDITAQDNLKKLINLNTSITKDKTVNTMINMIPANPRYPVYIYFNINNELLQKFSGSFYVSFNTDLINNDAQIYLCKIETKDNISNIEILISKSNDKYFIEYYSSEKENKKTEIKNFFNEDKKLLSFLLMFKYNNNDKTIRFVVNDSEEVVLTTTFLIIKSLVFGKKSSMEFIDFKSKVVDGQLLNCYLGGIRFYNNLLDYGDLKNNAFYKSKDVETENKGTSNNVSLNTSSSGSQSRSNIETQSQSQNTSLLKDVQPISIQQAQIKRVNRDGFTNYSPSAELFRNIR